jgi:two-component system phosphate regulon sensor histidine kinase PhoR
MRRLRAIGLSRCQAVQLCGLPLLNGRRAGPGKVGAAKRLGEAGMSMASVLERIWRRNGFVLAVLLVSAGYVAAAGLRLGAAVLAAAAVVAWAALWPEAAPASGPDRGRSGLSPSGAGGVEAAAGRTAFSWSLLEGLPDAALLLDGAGRVIAANAAAVAIAPVSIGRPVSQWSRAPDLLAAVDRAIATAAQQRCQIRQFAPVERSLEVIVTTTPVAAGRDVPNTLLVVLRDLTEQEQLARMRADFVANASHELRTPLATLRGFIETLQGAARNDPSAQERFLGIMQIQAERMSRLIDDLLSLSRIEMREHVPPTADVDLAAVVGDVVAGLRPIAEKVGITMSTTFPETGGIVIGDRDELAQVAQNLIQNAIKYGREGGKVEVFLRRTGNVCELKVRDDGIGIAPEHLPRLTERFYRVSAKGSKERGGTGLGLAIVKHIVNRHRGELRVESKLGEGSVFTVALPSAARMA